MLNAGVFDNFKGAATLLLWGDGEGMASLLSNFAALRDGSRTEFGIDGPNGAVTVCTGSDTKNSTLRAVGDEYRWDCPSEVIAIAADLIEPLLQESGHQFLDVTGLAERVIISRDEYPADMG